MFPATAGVDSFPVSRMYTVFLQYRIVVDAETNGEAYRKVRRMLKDEPGLFISRVEEGTGGDRKRKPLWKQFLFG